MTKHMLLDPENFGRAMGQIVREAIDLRLGTQRLEPAGKGVQHLDVRMAVQKFVGAGNARTVRGVATLPDLDRQGDIVEPMGGQWTLPLPLLWQHKHDQPIGWVRELSATRQGVSIVAELASGIDTADQAWRAIETGLVSSFSIGFVGQDWEPIATGRRWTKWSLLEVSVVTIPAAPGAKITATKGTAVSRGAVQLIVPPGHGAVKLIGPKS